MNDNKVIDKVKVQEILDEIANLKRYTSDLSNNVRGDKLDNLVNHLNKNITALNDKTEKIYDDNFLLIETEE